MTIEQKLEIIKRAMELGADVKIAFFQERTKEEAYKFAKNFPELEPKDLKNHLWLKESHEITGLKFDGAIRYV